MSARRLQAAFCGLGAVLLSIAVPVVGGALQPGYSHVSQYVSELGAQGAANAALVNVLGFAPIGVLVVAFLALAQRGLPRSAATRLGTVCFGAVGAAYFAASVFPCDPGCPAAGSSAQAVHSLFGLLEYIGAAAGTFILAWAFRRDELWRPLALQSTIIGFAIAAALIAMLMEEFAAYRGLIQRIAEAAIFLWIARVSVGLIGMIGPPSPRSM